MIMVCQLVGGPVCSAVMRFDSIRQIFIELVDVQNTVQRAE